MVDLVGVGHIRFDLRRHLKSTLPEIKFFFAVTPPSERFFEKWRSLRSFAMVDLGGVGEVSERFEHFFFYMGFNGDLEYHKRGRGVHRKGRSHLKPSPIFIAPQDLSFDIWYVK